MLLCHKRRGEGSEPQGRLQVRKIGTPSSSSSSFGWRSCWIQFVIFHYIAQIKRGTAASPPPFGFFPSVGKNEEIITKYPKTASCGFAELRLLCVSKHNIVSALTGPWCWNQLIKERNHVFFFSFVKVVGVINPQKECDEFSRDTRFSCSRTTAHTRSSLELINPVLPGPGFLGSSIP